MRAFLVGGGVFLVVGLLWAVGDRVRVQSELAALAGAGEAIEEAERALLRRGRAAQPALRAEMARAGAEPGLRQAAFRCARLLALQGDRDGDETLLEGLAAPSEADAAWAEELLLGVWDRRDGPDPAARPRGLSGDDPASLGEPRHDLQLDLLLEKHPDWVAGHVLRARRFLYVAEHPEAVGSTMAPPLFWTASGAAGRRAWAARAAADAALEALREEREPRHFGALEALARALLLNGHAEASRAAFERAFAIHPRLRARCRDTYEAACRAAAEARERKLRDRRMALPLL